MDGRTRERPAEPGTLQIATPDDHLQPTGGVGQGTAGCIPPERLAAPTLGAWRRAHGITGWALEGRHAFAVALVDEALRRAILDRLDGILIALHRGHDPRHIAARVTRLAVDLQPLVAREAVRA
jgi:hypothetical protein